MIERVDYAIRFVSNDGKRKQWWLAGNEIDGTDDLSHAARFDDLYDAHTAIARALQMEAVTKHNRPRVIPIRKIRTASAAHLLKTAAVTFAEANAEYHRRWNEFTDSFGFATDAKDKHPEAWATVDAAIVRTNDAQEKLREAAKAYAAKAKG